MARIGVEDSLTDITAQLQQNGHEVVALEENNVGQCDCCVISGQDKNMMGMEDIATKASVINAEGMTTDDVIQAVNQRVGQ